MGCEKGDGCSTAAVRSPAGCESHRLRRMVFLEKPSNIFTLTKRFTAHDEFQTLNRFEAVGTSFREGGLNSPSDACEDGNQNSCRETSPLSLSKAPPSPCNASSETGANSPFEMSLSNLVGEEEETPGEEEQGEREMMLQDFLAKEGGRSSDVSPDFVGVFRPRPAMTQCVSAPTTTLLSLNSMGCHEMQYLDWLGGFDPRGSPSLHDLHHHNHRHHLQQHMPEPQGFGPFCRKRGGLMDGDETVDRRQKRMIKNRESAARSRARKQAYTNELEIEIAHLVEENVRLREQQQQQNHLRQVQQEQQRSGNQGSGSRFAKEKPVLRRTSTAPF
ncbi:uncharacterized protein LOC116260713 [Nymphaea colorata]|uniref:uncharacterized protein LOC116260713 n=1 Tax=Nymphaea colorata TaxID=210225 RepID=UPI00129D6412|nr:uncharacterized protein LOC116260713 [Nymphaea colorata]